MSAVVAAVQKNQIRHLAANRVHKDADSEEGMWPVFVWLAVFICVSTHSYCSSWKHWHPQLCFNLGPSVSPHKLLLVPSCWGLISLSNHHLWEGNNLLTPLEQPPN